MRATADIRSLLCLACLGLASATTLGADRPSEAAVLQVTDARIRSLLPGLDTTSGYMTVTNTGPGPVTIVGAESAVARAVEFHTTRVDADMVRMRRLETVTVPAGATVRFEPGGNHLMLFGVNALAAENPITLVLGDGSTLDVRFGTTPVGGN